MDNEKCACSDCREQSCDDADSEQPRWHVIWAVQKRGGLWPIGEVCRTSVDNTNMMLFLLWYCVWIRILGVWICGEIFRHFFYHSKSKLSVHRVWTPRQNHRQNLETLETIFFEAKPTNEGFADTELVQKNALVSGHYLLESSFS